MPNASLHRMLTTGLEALSALLTAALDRQPPPTAPHEIARFDLSAFDGVLCFGEVMKRIYLKQGWTRQASTWHEAADTGLFHPRPHTVKRGDLVWIGNWGDGERTEALQEFLLQPAPAPRAVNS